MEVKWKYILFQIWSSKRLQRSFQWPRLTHGLQRGKIMMLLPFLPALQQFIFFNLTRWNLFAWTLEIQQLPCAVSTEQNSPITCWSDPAHSHDCPASEYSTCPLIRHKFERATQFHSCCLQKTNSSTAIKSAKIIQCFPLDPRQCFLASLGTPLLAHLPQPPKAIEMLV